MHWGLVVRRLFFESLSPSLVVRLSSPSRAFVVQETQLRHQIIQDLGGIGVLLS